MGTMPDRHFNGRFEALWSVDLRQNDANPLFDLELLHKGAKSITRTAHENIAGDDED
jgi:hypothetical protein